MNSQALYPAKKRPCIFVTGIWKSGNHLAYSALNALGIEGPINGISAHLVFGKNAWAKRILRGARNQNRGIQVGLETDAFISSNYISKETERLAGRILGGHAAHTLTLERTIREAGARMICIRRDPRDILVSFADWIGSRPDFYMHPDFSELSRERRVSLLLKGGHVSFGKLHPFGEILHRGYGWLTAPGVFQISFENLIGEAGGGSDIVRDKTLQNLHSFLGLETPLDLMDPNAIYGKSLTFNKGSSQRWRELESMSLLDEMSEILEPHLEKWGYSK